MTLPELLGSVGGLIVAIAAPIAAYVLGYGGLVVLAAVPVGFLVGWMLGAVVATPLIIRLQAMPDRRERADEE